MEAQPRLGDTVPRSETLLPAGALPSHPASSPRPAGALPSPFFSFLTNGRHPPLPFLLLHHYRPEPSPPNPISRQEVLFRFSPLPVGALRLCLLCRSPLPRSPDAFPSRTSPPRSSLPPIWNLKREPVEAAPPGRSPYHRCEQIRLVANRSRGTLGGSFIS